MPLRSKREWVEISKTMSYALRHVPQEFGLSIEAEGWVRTLDLVNAMQARGIDVTLGDLLHVVNTNDKKRFELADRDTGSHIRALQGHTTEDVQREFPKANPIGPLFHGTPTSNLTAIAAEGLKKMARHHVHLSATMRAAHIVGRRYKTSYTVLKVDAQAMAEDGLQFFLSENGVWLIDHVPTEYITPVFYWKA